MLSKNSKSTGKNDQLCQFFDAASSGNLKALDHLLLQNGEPIDVNANNTSPSGRGATPVMMAAEHGHVSVIRLLVEKGANINATNSNGATALMYAIVHGQVNVVCYLLEQNADVNVSNVFGNTAMMAACHAHQAEIAALLMSSEADINIKNKVGNTALMIAAEENQVDIARLLIEEHGACVDRGRGDYSSAMVLAAKHGHKEMMKLLGKSAKMNLGTEMIRCALVGSSAAMKHLLTTFGAKELEAHNEAGFTPFLYAAQKGHTDVMQVLVDYGANINAATKHGDTALMLASRKNKREAIEFLFEHDADVNATVRFNNTALLEAVDDTPQLDTVRLLVERGADVNQQQQSGRTPLMLASMHGALDVIKYLIEQGAKIDVPPPTHINRMYNEAPLVRVLRYNYLEETQLLLDMIHLLLAKGVDINMPDANGDSALSEAVQDRHRLDFTIVEELLKNGALIDGAALRNAIKSGSDSVATFLIEKASDEVLNAEGVITCATARGNLDILHLLFKRGANPNIPSSKGRKTALMEALPLRDSAVLMLLLQHGADVNAEDSSANTALMEAIKVVAPARDWKANALDVLLASGARVSATNTNDGNSALHLALLLHNGHPDMTDAALLLLKWGAMINAPNTQTGATPLLIAARRHDVPLMLHLMEHAGEVNVATATADDEVMKYVHEIQVGDDDSCCVTVLGRAVGQSLRTIVL